MSLTTARVGVFAAIALHLAACDRDDAAKPDSSSPPPASAPAADEVEGEEPVVKSAGPDGKPGTDDDLTTRDGPR